MKIEVSMVRDEDKLSVSSWWATSPSFVLYALGSQLGSAKAIWPEALDNHCIGVKMPTVTPPPIPPPSSDDPQKASNKFAAILARFFPGPEVDEVWRAMEDDGLEVVYSSPGGAGVVGGPR